MLYSLGQKNYSLIAFWIVVITQIVNLSITISLITTPLKYNI